MLATLAAMLLGTTAALMLVETRTAHAASNESLRFAKAELSADRALAEAIVMLDGDQAHAMQGLLFQTGDQTRVTRQDAMGLVDLNAAPPERLAALITALGLDPDEAARLSDNIADWRDEDGLARLHGAERTDYVAAHMSGPGNRPFEVETELASVLGATPPLVACLAPYLTVFSGAPEVEPSAAPPSLRGLLGLSSAQVTEQGPPLGQVVELSAEAPISPHAALRKRIWMRLTGDPRNPYVVHRAMQDFVGRETAPPTLSCAHAGGSE